jgi:hypothetical protein
MDLFAHLLIGLIVAYQAKMAERWAKSCYYGLRHQRRTCEKCLEMGMGDYNICKPVKIEDLKIALRDISRLKYVQNLKIN